MPKRSSVDDFFAHLSDVQRPHLGGLRQLSRDADPEAREELKWNLPVYVRGNKTSLWKELLRARVEEYEATGAGWNDR